MPSEITLYQVPAQPIDHRVSNVDKLSDNYNSVYHNSIDIYYLIRYVCNV